MSSSTTRSMSRWRAAPCRGPCSRPGEYEEGARARVSIVRALPRGEDIGAATFGMREVQIVFHLLGALRPAAILEGAFDYLTNRYGISAPPAFSEFTRRIWPGSEAIRDELGAETYEALRGAGAAMTLDEVAALIDESVSEIRQARPAMSAPPSHRLTSHGTPASPRPCRLRRRARRVRGGRGARGLRRRRPEPVGSFRAVFEALAAGPADPAGVVPIENVVNGTVRENYDLLLEHDLGDRRRGRRAGPAVASRRCPARASTTSSGSTRTSRPWARPRRSCGRGRGSSSRPTTLLAPANPSPSGASGGLRPCSRRVPQPCSDSRSSRTTSRTSRTTAPGSSSFRRPARISPRPSTAVPADDARARGAQRAGHAPRGARGVRAPRPEHEQAGVPAEPRTRVGVCLLGRPRRGRLATPRRRRPSRELEGVTTMLRVLGSYPRGSRG